MEANQPDRAQVLAAVTILRSLPVLLLMCAAGCMPNPGGAGGGDTDAPVSYHGRITSIVTGNMPAETLSSLTDADRAKLAQDGITIQSDPPAVISPQLPLQGHWVEFGGRRYMTDEDGQF